MKVESYLGFSRGSLIKKKEIYRRKENFFVRELWNCKNHTTGNTTQGMEGYGDYRNSERTFTKDFNGVQEVKKEKGFHEISNTL